MKLLGKIKNAEIAWDNPDAVRNYLIGIGEDKEIECYITRRKRSDRQNRYYWGVLLEDIVRQIEKETGQDAQDIHDFYKTKFLRRIIHLRGREIEVIGSTAALKKDEFQEYVEKIKNHAVQFFGVIILENI